MKRSEMLSFIKGILGAGLDYDFETQAENLLCNLEEKGMLPPWNPLGSEPLEGHVMYCQWSPEDE